MSVLPFQKEMRTVLVDDEEIATHRLQKALESYPAIKTIGVATDGIMALELINSLRPELVFLDIQMPGLNGFEVIRRLDYMPMIVFLTAYEEYAIQAFETNSLDYLLKPFSEDRLAITIRRVMDRGTDYNEDLKKIAQLIQERNPEPITSIPVILGNKINLIPVADIFFFEADSKYVILHTASEEKIIDLSLTYLEERLPSFFIRVHRKHIVNTVKIKEMHKYFKGTFLLVMDNLKNTRIKSSASYSKNVKAKLLLP